MPFDRNDHPPPLIRNIGLMLSGALEAPVLDADAILIESGRIVTVGRAADLVIMDRPAGSAGVTLLDAVELGDLPGIGMVIIDGEILVAPSRNTPPAERRPVFIAPARR